MQRSENADGVIERIDDNLKQRPTEPKPKLNNESPRTQSTEVIKVKKKAQLPENCRFQESLKKVLLVINFNFIHYTVLPTLREFYTPHFGKVVFCGPEEDARYGKIIKMNSVAGYQGYHCLAKAIEIYRGAGFDGYFYSNDDVMLHFWNLNGDINKIWLGDKILWNDAQELNKPLRQWSLWTGNTERCKDILNKLANDSTAISYVQTYNKNVMRHFYKVVVKDQQQLVPNPKQEQRICVKGWSDAFYIPARHAESYLRLANMFEAEKLFLEIASAMILTMLDDVTQMLNLNGIYHAGNKLGFYGTYSFGRTFSHPFKLGKEINKQFFKNVIVPYSQHIVNDCKLVA